MTSTNRLSATQSRAATGGRDEWQTPPELIDAIQSRWRVWLGFDVACTDENRIRTAVVGHFGRTWDGLAFEWHTAVRGLAKHNDRPSIALWCNPPYSQASAWMEKACKEAHQHGVRSVCLVPVRTDTQWWNAHVHPPAHMPYGAARVTLLKGRLKFGHPSQPKPQSAPFPSCLVWYEPGHANAPQYEVWDWRAWRKHRVEFARNTGAANDNWVQS